jgi:hypothetical protein
MLCKGFEGCLINAYATLTEETDVKPSAQLVSAYVAPDPYPSDLLRCS